jgi:hypothetical protein
MHPLCPTAIGIDKRHITQRFEPQLKSYGGGLAAFSGE